MMHKLYSFASVDFWLTVRMRILNHDKLDHTQAMYLWFSISLYIHKTDSEVKMRVHMSAYSTTPSVRSTSSYFHLPVVTFLIHILTWTAFMWVLSNFPLKLFYRNCLETDSINISRNSFSSLWCIEDDRNFSGVSKIFVSAGHI